MYPSRKNPSEQLSCFKFLQIRPLRASNFTFPETGQFYPKMAVFGFKFVLRKFYVHTTSNGFGREPTTTCSASNVTHAVIYHLNIFMQSKTLGCSCTKPGFAKRLVCITIHQSNTNPKILIRAEN